MKKVWIKGFQIGLFLLCTSLLVQEVASADPRVDGCQCTDFVYSQRTDIPDGMGHARSWLASARYFRLPYDRIPQLGDVVVILNGQFGFSSFYGHVAIVIGVNETRDRFSIAGWDGMKNDCNLEIHLDFPVTTNTFFIHRKYDAPQPENPLSDWLLSEIPSSDDEACEEIGDVTFEEEWLCKETVLPTRGEHLPSDIR
ncbi:MAG: CHAP domain-containing protein [Anaerolineales bacterium]|nr:CHAP domain-containing protein [Anaerolineales bacterium]